MYPFFSYSPVCGAGEWAAVPAGLKLDYGVSDLDEKDDVGF